MPSAPRHPSDRRRVVVTRTAEASAALAEEAAPLAGDVGRLAASLSDEERQAVGRFLDTFITIVERAAAEACLVTAERPCERSAP